jgi:hypothetical protein
VTADARRGCDEAARANTDRLNVDQCRDTHRRRHRPPRPRGCLRSIISRLRTNKQNKIKIKRNKKSNKGNDKNQVMEKIQRAQSENLMDLCIIFILPSPICVREVYYFNANAKRV